MPAVTRPPLPESYFRLVRAFPLTHILDDRHLDEACRVIDALLMQNLDAGGESYVEALTDLVEAYERAHVMIPDVSEAEVLSGLMTANSLTQIELSKRTGISQSTISAVLNGKRSLTKEQIVRLGELFGVSPTVFLPSTRR